MKVAEESSLLIIHTSPQNLDCHWFSLYSNGQSVIAEISLFQHR